LGKPLRDGDPICDSYGYLLRDDGIHISCVADGCSWGRAPQLAAKQAKTAFIDFLDKNTRLLTDTVTVGHALLLAMRHAHEMVMKARDPSFIGTTTLLGGILLQLEPESVTALSSPSSSPNAPLGTATSQTPPSSAPPSRWTNGGIPKWCWVYINVGDCKVGERTKTLLLFSFFLLFLYTTQEQASSFFKTLVYTHYLFLQP
jgi:hypothetical protein